VNAYVFKVTALYQKVIAISLEAKF